VTFIDIVEADVSLLPIFMNSLALYVCLSVSFLCMWLRVCARYVDVVYLWTCGVLGAVVYVCLFCLFLFQQTK